jgi:uncharacterized DUF497 family protein
MSNNTASTLSTRQGSSMDLRLPTKDRLDYSEERFVTLGILGEFVVSIVHTESPRVIRIISFRKATKHEQAIFFKYI